MKFAILFASALLAAPVSAQQSVPAPQAAVDPARLALAKTAIGHIWPTGTYARMMRGALDQVVEGMIHSWSVTDMADVVDSGGSAASPGETATTILEDRRRADPHFDERLAIMSRVVSESLVPLMNRIEPELRDAMARVYARKFSARQLGEMNLFFATPTGRLYASESMMLYVDPEVVALIGRIGPDMQMEMPAIMRRFDEASAHLPPPPPPAPESGEESD